MHSINVYELNGFIKYSEKLIGSLELASIQDIAPSDNTEITTKERTYVFDNSEWIMHQPIGSLIETWMGRDENTAEQGRDLLL